MTKAAQWLAMLLLCSAVWAQPDGAYSKSAGFAAYRQGTVLFGQSKLPEALAAVDQALALDARLMPALLLKAKLAMANNRYDIARECLERAMEVEPSSGYAAFLYGFQFYQQNEMPRAIAALQKARGLDARDPRSALYLGMAEETVGNTAEAATLYQDAIRLEEASGKPHADPFLAYARLLLVEGGLDDCGRLIARALKLEPGSRDARFEHARLLLKQGHAAESAAEGEAALALKNGDVTDRQVHYLLIQAYRAAGREQEAAVHVEAIRAIEKQDRK